MKKLSLLLGCAALASVVSAQSVVVPQGMATTNAGVSGLTWRNTAFRFQMVYDTSHFLDQGLNVPISISRLQFRANGGLTSPGGETYTGVTVQMSSSPLDFDNTSTSFAARRGLDNATVFTGNVVCLAAAGTSPNTYIIDIPLATPFVYDPTNGLDLCVEIDAPLPVPATVPSMATGSNVTHKSRRISAATQAATTGSLSYFASVILMDYTLVPNAASASKYGAGCVAKAQTFYEAYPAGTFDLAGTPSTVNSIALTPLGGGYGVATGSNTWFTPTSTAIVLTDDSLSAIMPLGFTFNYPGGSTTGIKICSNGFIWLDTTRTASTFSGTPGLLVAEGARLAPLWQDLDPGVGGTVHFDVDPSLNTVYATWTAVPQFANATLLNTLQVAISSNGSVEYRYMDCANDAALLGWSPGGGARDGGALDISAAMPFVTEPDAYPLALEPINRPKIGTTHNLEIRRIPTGASIGAFAVGVLQFVPGTDLTGIGMPTCFMHCSFDFSIGFAITGVTQAIPLPIPAEPSIAGVHIYGQSISTAPGTNALDVITSNGVDLLFDIN
ncbi:MAG: hypothetical protein HZB39_08200 [Planctomycetes bacterium]|nr:hypothetical protein [Planctomycetota bacterium]